MDRCDVAILGAGPYGISAAAHLGQIKGLDVRLLGEPMSFWERHMPERMLLRSPWAASSIADPDKRLCLDAYRSTFGLDRLRDSEPLPAADFIRYGHWVLEQLHLRAEGKVRRVEAASDGYKLTLEQGDTLMARRVVVAGGIQPFVYRPEMFRGLPDSLVTHTSEQRDFKNFRNKEVLIIGAGQSALEAAGFMRAAGAQVDVLIRNPDVRWLGKKRQWLHAKPVRWMFYGKGDIGPAGVSLFVQHPNLFRRLPRRIQDWWGPRAIRPAVFDNLMASTDVRIHGGRFPVNAQLDGERLRVQLNDGTYRAVDHVVLGTGYRVDVSRYPFLSPALIERIDRVNGYPVLDAGFETSSTGLHFVGAPAAYSFGPLMRFVAGTEFCGLALQRRVGQARQRSLAAHGRSDISEALYGKA
jgi:cation diffusion facilitator CzcD-associated flavoprotein CzcO